MTGLASPPAVAVVVSPHGFGHAARIGAVVERLGDTRPGLKFQLLTTVPRWFFADSLSQPFAVQRLFVDVGLVQRSPLEEDLDATVHRLDRLLASPGGPLDRLTRRIQALGCRLILCDISPLGIAAGRRLGLPTVLVENFTWDWVYRGYEAAGTRLMEVARTMERLYADADLHIQSEPWCCRASDGRVVPPIARRSSMPPHEVKAQLGIPDGDPMVLLTMGGVRWDYAGLEALEHHGVAHFVVPGGSERTVRRGRLTLLPFRSRWRHPDLVAASEVVVGKLGYSTVAETYQGGGAMAFIHRPRFPESRVLAKFVNRKMASVEITESAFNDGSWVQAIDPLLDRPRRPPRAADGADQAARLILDHFGGALH